MIEIKLEIRALIALIEQGNIVNYKIVDKLNQFIHMLDELEQGE